VARSSFDPIPLLAAFEELEYCALQGASHKKKGTENNIFRTKPTKEVIRTPIRWEVQTDGRVSNGWCVLTLHMTQKWGTGLVEVTYPPDITIQGVVDTLHEEGYSFTHVGRQRGVTTKLGLSLIVSNTYICKRRANRK
jgi:hypothetical protein